jgi:IS30 family transposase
MSYAQINKHERNEISVLLKKGYSVRDIGSALGRSPSSISREIRKNSVKGRYQPDKAELKAYIRKKYAKFQWQKIRQQPLLENFIRAMIKDDWTPEEIAGRLKAENGNRTVVSFKTIYNYLDSPFGRSLKRYLPHHRKRKKSGHKKAIKQRLKGRIFIDQRPPAINHRKFLGHFEADTMGKPKTGKQVLAGMADRKSRYFLAKKTVLKETIETFKELAKETKTKSYTLDNGLENARHQELGVKTYFCHPYSAWEKPTIENTFQRLRRFIPKKTKLEEYSDEQIATIVKKMNYTPRKCLGYLTPYEVHFNKKFQLTKCCT